MVWWHLFVDESGDFQRDRDVGVVGGVMVRGTDSLPLRRALREGLAEWVYPWTTYPPHANVLNIAASRVAFDAYRSLGDPPRTASELYVQSLCEAIAPTVGHRPEYAAVSEAAKADNARWAPAGNHAPWRLRDRIERLDESLRYHGAEHQQLTALRDRQTDDMIELLRGLDWHFEVDGTPVEVFPIGAWGRADVPGGGTATWDAAPYARRLCALLTHAASLLKGDGHRHDVYLHVAEIDLLHPVLGPLTRTQLESLCEAALRASGAEGAVRIFHVLPKAYDVQVHAGLALADFVVNRLRKVLANDQRRWEDVAAAVEHVTGLSPSRAATDRPSLVFDGVLPIGTRRAFKPSWAGAQNTLWRQP